MTISDKLAADMKAAMKSGDKAKLSVIRMLRADLKNAEIAAGEPLTEEQEQKVLAAYAKKRREAREHCVQLGRQDLADKEEFENSVTMSYLPSQLGEAELTTLIKEKMAETGAEGTKDFGAVMKAVMQVVGSRAEGSTVSALVRKILSG
ncbi:MAG: GatB/YqeY domain-containing protein [Candidatus Krumholzibacteria bacterium]|nr:GatB/YqeY domain-containing protein [Candidatus Krumholzibacteria bacterium]